MTEALTRRAMLATGAALLAAPATAGASAADTGPLAHPNAPPALAARLAQPETGGCTCVMQAQTNADAELIDACRAYIAASQDYDAHGGYLDYEVCPWWAAVGAAAARAESYEPRTMAGVRAMAEVAAHWARQPDGELDWSDSFTGAWPARVCQAVLRLTAAE